MILNRTDAVAEVPSPLSNFRSRAAGDWLDIRLTIQGATNPQTIQVQS